MTSEEPFDGSKETNEKEKGDEIEPKRSFRAEYARKSHNSIEKKRKDKIAIWINKISELLPKDPKKESKNAILEKAFHYMVHLKEMNDKLIYGNASQITGDELRSARKRIKKLEDTNAVYYKLLKMSGITPTNIPLDVMNSNPLQNAKSKPESSNNDNPDNSGDDQSDIESDTTEVIKDDEPQTINQKPNNLNTHIPMGLVNDRLLNTNNLANGKIPLLVVNQNQDNNAPRISLSNGSQLQIRPSPNVQILGNGALAIDNSGFNQGPIILGSTLLSPPQPTTLIMHNGQLLSLVNQPQPAFVYTPGSGFVLTSSTPINSTSINLPAQPKPQADQPEKTMRKGRLSNNNNVDLEKSSPEVSTPRLKRGKVSQKTNSKLQINVNTNDGDNNGQVNNNLQTQQQDQVRQKIQLPPKKKRGRPFKVPPKAKETSDKLTVDETNTQNSETITTGNNDKRARLTTVIERVSDSPIKRCARNSNKANKGSTKDLNDELGETDLETENYSFRQNGEATCEQDQLPLLLDSLSEDHEMSTESVHSVSNSSLPTFLSLSPSDHLTDFLSKTSDHGNGTTRSPRYSSPMNRINSNTSNTQTTSVIMSNQGNNIITEHDGDSYSNPISHQHHHHHHQQHHSNEPLDSNSYPSNTSNNTGQGRLYSTDLQDDRRRSDPSDKSASSQSVARKTQEPRDSTSAPAQQTSTGNSTLDSPPSSSTNNNNPSTNQLLPYSAESLLRQQPQQSTNTNNMPTSVPINSIYHVQSNVTVDANIDFSNRGNSTSGNTSNNGPSARPNISYSAERLIHSPPGENNPVSSSSNRQKSSEPSKVTIISGANSTNSTSNNQAPNIYNEQYSNIRTARGSTDLDPDLTRLQSTHHQQHHQQQTQHSSNMYRSSPQAHDQRGSQEQHLSTRTGGNNLNVNNQSNQTQQQQIMHQQRNTYSDNHHHHQQPPPAPPSQPQPQPPPTQQPRGQSHQSTQATSSSQGQINLKTTSTSTNNNSSPTASTNTGNSGSSNGRELFNHYPYGSSEGSTSERNLMNFSNSGNGQNEGFMDNASSSGTQNNFLSPFPPNSNCQPSFGPNNRRSSNSSTSMLTPFNFSDPSFSDSYNRQAHGVSGNSTNSAVNFSDSNRRLSNPGHFVDHHSSTSSSNNPSNNYFMAHNHHVSSSSLSNSNNPPIFSASSSFPSLISSSTNSNYDNNGYNLACPPRTSSSSINTSSNISPTSNSNAHHHHSHHHPTFYSDSGVSAIQSMTNTRRPPEPTYSASSANGKSSTNSGNTSTVKNTNSTPSASSAGSKQSVKSAGGSSSKSTKKASSTPVAKIRIPENPRPNLSNVSNPSLMTSYSSTFAPPPPPPPSASAVPVHSANRSISTSTSSSTLLHLSSASERPTVDSSESLFRPQSQSNASANMQPTSSTPRSTGSSTHGLTSVGHSSSLFTNFQYPLLQGSLFEVGPINPNENFSVAGLPTIKFPNHAANVLSHHPGSNAPFAHSSTLQSSVPMDNTSGSMSDNASHQNIYGHHSRIATPHHNPFHYQILPSPRTLK